MRFVVAICLLAAPLAAQTWSEPSLRDAVRQQHLYTLSLAMVTGAAAADVASSWGRPELNPLLSPHRAQAQFGWQAVAIKAGVTGASLLMQRQMLRAKPDLHRAFTVANFATAAAMGAVASRNYRAGAPRPAP